MKKYEKLAADIENKIINQHYKQKDKLPSINLLAKQYNCSKSTVIKCYELLEKKHLIYTKHQSGHYVADNMVKPITKENEYALNTGNPIVSITSLIDAKHCLSMAIENYSYSSLNISLQGFDSLRKVLPNFLEELGIYAKDESIYLIQGVTQMLSFLTTTTFPNQKEYILIEEPTYSYYVEFLKTIDIPVITIPRNENGIDIKQLEYLFKNYPIKFYYTVPRNHNPLGTTFNVNTRKEIARLALEYDVYIIEDDYLGHCFSLPRYLPIYYYASSKNCIYLTSFSKTIPFLRIGICVIDPCLKKLFEEMIHESYYYSYQLPSLMSQATLESYISSELYKKQMQALNIHFNPHFKILKQITSSWDKNIAYIISDYTGYYFSVVLNKKIDLDKLEDALLHKNILIARNERCFYYKENFNHSIRLSIARIEKKELEKALNIFYETAVNEYKKIM